MVKKAKQTGPGRLSDAEKLNAMGVDAAEWARGFVEATGSTLDPSPGGLVYVWFCNALEAGRLEGAAHEARTGDYASGMEIALGPGWAER